MNITYIAGGVVAYLLASVVIKICFRKRLKAYIISGNKSIREEESESKEAVNAWPKSQK